MINGVISWLYTLPRRIFLSRLKRLGLKVGENLYIGSGVFIDSTWACLITIGDNVAIADRVYIMAHDASTKYFVNHTRIGKVKIGNGVFIGTGATILPGVHIGDNVIIGSGSVITQDILGNSVVSGNPARVIGTVEQFIAKKEEEMKAYPVFDEGVLRTQADIKRMREIMKQEKYRYGYVF